MLLSALVLGATLAPGAVAANAGASPSPCGNSNSSSGSGSGGLTGALVEADMPATLPDSLDPAIVGSFAVLRRAAGPQDQVPPLNSLAEQVGIYLSGYYPGYVRRVFQLPDGRRLILISGLPRVIPVPPAQCLARTLRPRRNQLVEQQLRRATEPVYCLGVIGGRPSSFSGEPGCRRFADVYTGANLLASDTSTSPVVELAPDGVASVRLSYRDGTTITAQVLENAYMFTPPQAPIRRANVTLERVVRVLAPAKGHRPSRGRERSALKLVQRTLSALAPVQVQWLAADGRLLRIVTP
jgi:hypothetical protein